MLILAALVSEGINVRSWTHGYQDSIDMNGAIHRAQQYGMRHQPIYLEPLHQLQSDDAFQYARQYLKGSSGMVSVLDYWHLPWVLKKVDIINSISGTGGEAL